MEKEFIYKDVLIKLKKYDNGSVSCFNYKDGYYIGAYSIPQSIISQGEDAIILYAKSYVEFNLNR